MRLVVLMVCVFVVPFALTVQANDAAITQQIEQVRSVALKGENHKSAVEAAQKLQAASVDQLPQILAGMKGASPLATNWLRGVAESVAAQHVAAGGKLPVADLEKFFHDTEQAPRARRLAYEIIASVDAAAEKRLIPGLQTDPSLELRFDAIRLAIDEAAELEKAGDKTAALALYGEAFVNVRDLEQVKQLAAKLKEHKQGFDLPTKLGFVTQWRVIGPFDNVAEKGWDVAFEPEKKVDFDAEYQGQKGPVKWIEHATEEEYGIVDLNKALDKHKGAIAYAASEFVSEKAQTVDIRLGCICASKIWVNGELLTANHIYHTGMAVDQYRGTAKLKPGKNVILVKIAQNEQTEPWAQDWRFQLRVCDSLGGPILSQDRIVPKTASK